MTFDPETASRMELMREVDRLLAEVKRLREVLDYLHEAAQDLCRQAHTMKDGAFYNGLYQGHENMRVVIEREVAALKLAEDQ